MTAEEKENRVCVVKSLLFIISVAVGSSIMSFDIVDAVYLGLIGFFIINYMIAKSKRKI